MTTKKKKFPKHIYFVIPLDDEQELDLSSVIFQGSDTEKSAKHLFGDEVAERRPAAIVRLDTSSLTVLKKHNRNKYNVPEDDDDAYDD